MEASYEIVMGSHDYKALSLKGEEKYLRPLEREGEYAERSNLMKSKVMTYAQSSYQSNRNKKIALVIHPMIPILIGFLPNHATVQGMNLTLPTTSSLYEVLKAETLNRCNFEMPVTITETLALAFLLATATACPCICATGKYVGFGCSYNEYCRMVCRSLNSALMSVTQTHNLS